QTLPDVMDEPVATHGYYLQQVDSPPRPGIDGLKEMGEIMTRIRNNPPTEIGGVKVARVLDIQRGTETIVSTGEVRKLDYPESDVLYFAMEGGHFVCVRPSGTEPKIKLYVNVNDKDEQKAKALLGQLTAAAQGLLK
ncbi:MAG: phospho-sugar mutase, partial [Clostridia bacterium]|nr:phospho-sugar mutase [Clostridia bacterium]